jgi:hypothetical protein
MFAIDAATTLNNLDYVAIFPEIAVRIQISQALAVLLGTLTISLQKPAVEILIATAT